MCRWILLWNVTHVADICHVIIIFRSVCVLLSAPGPGFEMNANAIEAVEAEKTNWREVARYNCDVIRSLPPR